MSDIMEIPLFDKETKPTSKAVAKAYRLTEEEQKQWHTWVPPDKR
ncbi:MAG: hypothetical protein WAZ98_03875 [Cyclobacteriaceae bacterium]